MEDMSEIDKNIFIFSIFTKYAKRNGPVIKPGNLKAVRSAFVFPASPTEPISTEILLWDVTNVPDPNPAQINIKYWKNNGSDINNTLAIKWKNKPSIYVILNPDFVAIIGTMKLPKLWLIKSKVIHIPILSAFTE